MEQRRVTPLTTAGCFAAIMLVFALLSTYVPIFSFIGYFIMPIPMVIIFMKYGLRQTIADTPVEGPEDTFNITASLGITLFPAHDTDDLPQAMQRADQALYIAKSSGRNCVCEL